MVDHADVKKDGVVDFKNGCVMNGNFVMVFAAWAADAAANGRNVDETVCSDGGRDKRRANEGGSRGIGASCGWTFRARVELVLSA